MLVSARPFEPVPAVRGPAPPGASRPAPVLSAVPEHRQTPCVYSGSQSCPCHTRSCACGRATLPVRPTLSSPLSVLKSLVCIFVSIPSRQILLSAGSSCRVGSSVRWFLSLRFLAPELWPAGLAAPRPVRSSQIRN